MKIKLYICQKKISNMEDLKQGTRIEFDVQSFKGKGTIVGIASNATSIVGKRYIIQPDEKLQCEDYDYTHFVAFENQIKVIPQNF